MLSDIKKQSIETVCSYYFFVSFCFGSLENLAERQLNHNFLCITTSYFRLVQHMVLCRNAFC